MANNSMNETTDFTISFQVSEERLITLLEQINNQTTKQTKVTVSIHCLLHRYLLKYGMLSSVPNDLRIYSLIFRYKGVEAFLRMTISKWDELHTFMMYAYTSSLSCMVIACAIQYLPFYLFTLLSYFITSPLYSHLRLPQLLVVSCITPLLRSNSPNY